MNNKEGKIALSIGDIAAKLDSQDTQSLSELDKLYDHCLSESAKFDSSEGKEKLQAAEELAQWSKKIGDVLESVCQKVPNIHVYSFETVPELHAGASRIISKLRDPDTGHEEFIYYIQRAYELLFGHVYCDPSLKKKRSLITKTPVTVPSVNYASHKIPDVDLLVNNTVMCVMLRGALLPSIIVSKEIEDYSSTKYVTPFALFKISRDDKRSQSDMRYILDLNRSFFNLKDLDGKDLVFADPMNATGGSLITIIKFLKENNIKPKSIKFLNILATLKGSLNIVRSYPEVEIYTLWMDPVMNEKAYIMPGLGDAGDRLNGTDPAGVKPRNMIKLMADYGVNMAGLYKSQYRKIEETVFGEV